MYSYENAKDKLSKWNIASLCNKKLTNKKRKCVLWFQFHCHHLGGMKGRAAMWLRCSCLLREAAMHSAPKGRAALDAFNPAPGLAVENCHIQPHLLRGSPTARVGIKGQPRKDHSSLVFWNQLKSRLQLNSRSTYFSVVNDNMTKSNLRKKAFGIFFFVCLFCCLGLTLGEGSIPESQGVLAADSQNRNLSNHIFIHIRWIKQWEWIRYGARL